MKKIILITIFFSVVSLAQITNAHFESPFVFSDLLYSDTLILGYDAFATDSLDPQLGEEIVPQVPPGDFGARFQLPTDTSIYTLKDFRFGCGQPFYYEHLVDLSYGWGDINIDWEWSFELWMVHIIDPFTGQNIETLESYFDSSEYSIPLSMYKIVLGIQYNGPLSWPEYQITSPNGGETIIGGEYYTITWWSNGIIPPARLEYSSDAGNTWELISDSLYFAPNSYDWLVPYITSYACLVRVGDYPCAYDQSDGYFTITYTVSAENETELPKEFSLSQNYPNPFNPTTKIKYTIPATPLSFGEGLGVRLVIYDVLGNEVATLVNEDKPPGEYEVEFNSVETSRDLSLPSGVYFYQLRAGSFVETKKMMVTK